MSNNGISISGADQADIPAYGWTDLHQRFDPTQPAVSPAEIGPATSSSPSAAVLLHMAMGGGPDQLPPEYQHIVPQANLLLQSEPPSGPGLLGVVQQYPTTIAAATEPQTPAPIAADSDDEAGGEDQSAAGDEDGPNIPAPAATSLKPLDATVPD